MIQRLEERMNERIETVLETLRMEWIHSQSEACQKEPTQQDSLLETIAQSVVDDPDMAEILNRIREKVDNGEIDENDFEQIYAEIGNQERMRKSERDRKGLSAGVMAPDALMTFINKEIAVTRRYGTPLSALGFSLVKAKAAEKRTDISRSNVFDAFLRALATIFRDSDVVSDLGKNQYVVVLPMTPPEEARLALRRSMQNLHFKPLEVEGAPFNIKVAGVVGEIDINRATSATEWVESIMQNLREMAMRIRNLHVLS
jgi:GGDEF domain-containing protein